MKQTFRELIGKSELSVTFVPDVVMCCAILHNILLRQSHEEVEELLQVLRREGLEGDVTDEDVGVQDTGEVNGDHVAATSGNAKRTQLGVFLTTQRHHLP